MTIFGTSVTAPADARTASWVSSRVGEFGTVGGLVPKGFDRYVLVHPAPLGGPQSEDDAVLVSKLAPLVERHTTTPDLVWYAIWEGYGWASGEGLWTVEARGPLAWLTRARLRRRSRIASRSRASTTERS